MATNIGTKTVLIITMYNGNVVSVVKEGRSVYENTKGTFIKTIHHGNVYLDANNRAVISDRRLNYTRANGQTYSRMTSVDEPIDKVQEALHQLFDRYELRDFIK